MAAKRPPLRFGVQDDGALRRGDYRGINAARKMGARSVRIIVPRDVVAKEGWGNFDRMVRSARVRGLRPQLVLDRGGTWIEDLGGFSRFAKTAAHRYHGKVRRFSIENEPDLRDHGNPEGYRKLYQVGYRAVKGADRRNQVLFGEFSPHFAVSYARKALAKKGVKADGYALHPYQFTKDPLAPGPWQGSIGRLGQVRHAIAHMNIKTPMGRTPGMYLTEFGYQTFGPDALPPAKAAQYWQRAIRKARGAGARQLVAYHMSADTNPQRKWDTSLLDATGRPRPAYFALAAATRSRPRNR